MRLYCMFSACVAALVVATVATAGCGTEPDACVVPSGTYHIELPKSPAPDHPAILFLHGYGSSGAGALRNRDLVDAVLRRGYAVIAPDGLPRPGRSRNGWSFHPQGLKQRDEVVFLQAVRDDAAQRYGLNPDNMLLSGFSIGGSMTSYVACEAPDIFAAYAPVAGGFWRPHPATCAGPVKLLHTHGWIDTTVPLEGRVLRGTDMNDPEAFMQGDIFDTMEIWRAANGCLQLRGDSFIVTDQFWRRSWQRCTDGTALELALFPGGHGVPKGWAEMALDWFEGL
jgi:polyhydroxybutyrate depolymerase